MTVEYATYQLLTSTKTDDKAFKDKYDFYIIPIVNPDGFAYTQSTDRMWRKNRQTVTTSSCLGTDINRNWPNHWGKCTTSCM
jgi:carboxypeptidase A4